MKTSYHTLHLRVLMGLFLLAPPAWSFSVAPGVQVVTAKPGSSKDVEYQIDNQNDEPMVVSCTTRDSFVLPENKAFDAAVWAKPRFDKLNVPAKGSATGKVRLKIPKGASGELAAFVSCSPVVKPKPGENPSQLQTKVLTVITVSLYVRIEGKAKGEASLGVVTVENLPVRGPAPASVKMTVLVKNTGNVHQRPGGEFRIYKKNSTNDLYVASFRSGWPVMPYTELAYHADVPGQLEPGEYTLKTRVSFGPDTFIEKTTVFGIDKKGVAVNLKDL